MRREKEREVEGGREKKEERYKEYHEECYKVGCISIQGERT